MKYIFFLGLCVLGLVISGCTTQYPDCREVNTGYDVYVGDVTFHNCSISGPGAACSASGCSFNNCIELSDKDYIHSNQYVKRCPNE
jgi:hypothetical protein